jgi:hypothetical protein
MAGPGAEEDEPVIVFSWREIAAALAHARQGGRALHLHRIVSAGSPQCFRKAVARGERIAHLFDLNADRLARTARALRVRTLYLDREDTDAQHLDLCGRPLRTLLKSVGRECLFRAR